MGEHAATIVISGYYGYANSGDEAVLHSILTALEEAAAGIGLGVKPVVLSGNPPETARLHGVEAVHRMRPLEVLAAIRKSRAVISGGGSLLQDVTSLKSIPYYLGVIQMGLWLRKPVFIYAQGIGPVRRKGIFGTWIRSVFNACHYVSVRDDESKELLKSFGLSGDNVEVVPDPVMGLSPSLEPLVSDAEEEGPLVGVSIRYWREDRRDLDGIAEGIRQLMQQDERVRIVFYPFHLPADREASEYTAHRLKLAGVPAERVAVHPGTEHPRDLLQEVSRCDALIGMRLHALIYAAASGVPPIGVSYDPKIDRFLKQLGETPVGTTDSLHPDALADSTLREVRAGKAAWQEAKSEKISALQQNARKPAQQIANALRI